VTESIERASDLAFRALFSGPIHFAVRGPGAFALDRRA